MRNKYPGWCYWCNTRVEKGDGHFEKIKGTRNQWRTIHAKCVFEQRDYKEKLIKEGKEIENLYYTNKK